MSGTNKGSVGKADIDVGKKASVGAVISTNNSADSGGKVIDQHASLTGLAFATFVIADCADNSNLAVLEGIPSDAITFTSDEFLTTFATLTNTTLKKAKVCKSNPLLFVANHP